MSEAHSTDIAETLLATRAPRAVPNILIVDDSPETRFVYQRYLSRSDFDYNISEAETVEAGMTQLERERFDCVLLDFCLPDADGLELLNRIADGGGRLPVPVVMITGQGSEPVAVEAMKLGAKDYLVKDRITAESLIAAVEFALERARAENEQKQYRARLEQQSVTDPLTGLYNRRYLFQQLGVEMQRSTRYGPPLCLLMIDLDHFKQVNDTHGHLVGDRVLESFSEMLRRVARTTDIVARYGGEEFCAVLTNTGLDGGVRFAERVCAEARELHHHDSSGGIFTVTCSAGIIETYDGNFSAEALIKKGDTALYRAKRQGRDRICIYEACESVSA